MTHRSPRRATRVISAVAAAGVAFGLATAPASGAPSDPVADTGSTSRVHFNNGKAIAAGKGQAPGQVVKNYLATHGLDSTSAATLVDEAPAWTSRGVTHLRLGQVIKGLRVEGAEAKASFDKSGNLVALVESASKVAGNPTASKIDAAGALRAALGKIAPGKAAVTSGATTSGATTTFATQGFKQAPTAERVILPSGGSLAEGWVVTTWDVKNNLVETIVNGSGAVVDSYSRTASDTYNVFPEDPTKSAQTVVNGATAADPTASPKGWLGAGSQFTTSISGNNANAYLDRDNNNAPDPASTPVTDGNFNAVFDPNIQPTAGNNQAVAVQNLFYLNNTIHDTLYKAGFTEQAGNFQADNLGRGGKGGDAVNAEAQDGGGTDNANFATPRDGRTPTMQMYLWNAPITHDVVWGGVAHDATGAQFGPALNATGVTGPVVVANDNTGTTSDACEALAPVPAGSVVIADRGTCSFTIKVKNAQTAGAAAVIIANNTTGVFTMGGDDATITIPSVMLSQSDGAALKAALPTNATLRIKNPAPIMRDGDLDSDIVWHEYGHGLTWRMIGRMNGPISGAIGEGMSDVLSVIANNDPVVGEYSVNDPAGIRSHSYEGYNRTYGDIVGSEVHADGEVYGAIGWDLLKAYKAAGLTGSDLLADLVDGMNYTAAHPTFEQMRDGILDGLAITNPGRACLVWGSFAKYGVGVGAKAKVQGKNVTVTGSMALPAECSQP